MNKYRYLSIKEAVELGYPDLRGTTKNGRLFSRYVMYKSTSNVIAKYYTEKEIKNKKQSKTIRINKYKKIIQRYKMFCGCKVCGYKKHPVALHLNHKDPMEKKGMLSKVIKSWGWDKIKEEIRKCEVLCANCHSIHTYEEKHWKVRRDKANAEH
jgi:hypothetical protein